MRSRVTITVLGAMLAGAVAAPPAAADQQITAGPGQRYNNPSVTIAQGERLTFANRDIAAHDVTATTNGPDGRPLFTTPLIGQGESAFVEGSQYLTTGSYPFFCTIHANMTGTLTVSGEGTPVPRPGTGGPAADTTAPKFTVALKTGTVRKARADRAITVVVDLDEAAALTARALVAGRTVATLRAKGAAGSTKLRIRLSAAARRQLRAGRRLTVRAIAKDDAGNRSTRSASRTLR